MRDVGLRRRVVIGFAGGALLLSTTLTVAIDALSVRYLVEQRDRSASRQAVVNGDLVISRLPATTAGQGDAGEALTFVRLGPGTSAVLDTVQRPFSTEVGLDVSDLPAELVAEAQAGSASLQRYRQGSTPLVAVAVPLGDGVTYYEISELSGLDTTLRTIAFAGVVAALLTTLLGAALGLWATRRALRPLDDVARTAARLASGDLQARAPTTDDPDLAAIASSFNAMADTLASRIQRDAQFAADVSHELRSPLTTMVASASVLESRRSQLPPVAQQATDLLVADLGRFATLLEDLLDLARDYEPLRRDELPMFELADLVRTELELRGQTAMMHATGDSSVRADRRRLSRVVSNLIDNANTHGGGVMSVVVTQVRDRVRLAVSDKGPGIPAADREIVFERFSRGRATPSRGGSAGTGLGLALVREHVLAHEGATWYERAPGGGARFVVEIPAAKS